MFSFLRSNKNILNAQLARNFTEQKSIVEKQSLKWDLFAAVLVERLPIISKALNPIEKEFQSLLWQKEYEGSLKSDHELKNERDILQAELIKRGEIEIDLDETASKQTAQDLKDTYFEELKMFKFGTRVTEADQKNELISTKRALDESLYLVTEQKIGGKKMYTIPQGPRLENETMRQTAERILEKNCGSNINVIFYGNAPCAFYKYKYPPSLRKDSVGAKVFLYRTSWLKGNIETKILNKIAWQTKKELTNEIKGTYMEALPILLF